MKRGCRVVKLCIVVGKWVVHHGSCDNPEVIRISDGEIGGRCFSFSKGIMAELFLNELLLKTWCVTYICNNILFCLIAKRILCYTKTYIDFFTFIVHVYCIVSMGDAGEVNLVSFYLYNYKCMVTWLTSYLVCLFVSQSVLRFMYFVLVSYCAMQINTLSK